MSLNSLIWLNTFVAIIGTILNAKQKRVGFVIWMITNFVFAIYNIYMASYAQAALFSVYFGLAVYGWINWGKKPSSEKSSNEAKDLT